MTANSFLFNLSPHPSVLFEYNLSAYWVVKLAYLIFFFNLQNETESKVLNKTVKDCLK